MIESERSSSESQWQRFDSPGQTSPVNISSLLTVTVLAEASGSVVGTVPANGPARALMKVTFGSFSSPSVLISDVALGGDSGRAAQVRDEPAPDAEEAPV
jgi:hypothetical protein